MYTTSIPFSSVEELIHMMLVKNYESIPFGPMEELIHMVFVKNECIPRLFPSVQWKN